MKILFICIIIITFTYAEYNWDGNYTQWAVQPFNVSVPIDRCCNLKYAYITQAVNIISILIGFEDSTRCNEQGLNQPMTINSTLFADQMLFLNNDTSNWAMGQYIPTNNTIALTVGQSKCIWIIGNQGSKITTSNSYKFNWNKEWKVKNYMGIYSGITKCCLPSGSIKMIQNGQNIQYNVSYANRTVGAQNLTSFSAVQINTQISTNIYDSECLFRTNGLNYTYTTTVAGGSFFDPVSLFVGFSLPNGSVLLQTQNCLILMKYGTMLITNTSIIILLLLMWF